MACETVRGFSVVLNREGAGTEDWSEIQQRQITSWPEGRMSF